MPTPDSCNSLVGLDRAYRLAGLILGDALEAEDAVQDALLRAWRSMGSVRDIEGFGVVRPHPRERLSRPAASPPDDPLYPARSERRSGHAI